jgi:phage-related protein
VKVGQSALETGVYKGVNNAIQRVINALDSFPGEISKGLFIGVVRGSSNNV